MTSPPDPPLPARLLGPAGLIPFLALSLAALLGPEAWRAPALSGLAAYGAVILSFLGAVHWGLALRDPRAAWGRLGLGVVPSLLAWVALLLPPVAGLALLALAILGTAAVESQAARRGLVPPGYLRLRWGLSLGAAFTLGLGIVAWL